MFAFLPNIGGTEMVLLVVVGLLLYGRNLPEAGRSLGRVAAQLRRGWQEFKDQMDRDGDLSEVKKSLQGTADELRRVADVPRAIADPRRTLQNAARDMIESEPPPETAPAPSTTPATTDESPTSGDKQ
ncbi:MAG: twin-arginine translocase TatA/TatE family subunit [Planctomycetes bacterium]|nr:twin-arginine translocase TatA/TatE family subunit [Planctomycetota bacterium]